MALESVYRAENRYKSGGPRPGPFPDPSGAGLGRKAAPNLRFAVPPPQTQNQKINFDCIGVLEHGDYLGNLPFLILCGRENLRSALLALDGHGIGADPAKAKRYHRPVG